MPVNNVLLGDPSVSVTNVVSHGFQYHPDQIDESLYTPEGDRGSIFTDGTPPAGALLEDINADELWISFDLDMLFDALGNVTLGGPSIWCTTMALSMETTLRIGCAKSLAVNMVTRTWTGAFPHLMWKSLRRISIGLALGPMVTLTKMGWSTKATSRFSLLITNRMQLMER